MQQVRQFIQERGYSAEDAKRLVEMYEDLIDRSNPRESAAAILAKRAERFCETEPMANLLVTRADQDESATPYERRLARAYFALLTAVDWKNEDLITGLREGLNKFLSNVFLKSVLRGTNKHHCTHLISKSALALVEMGKTEELIFEHVVPKHEYIQRPCEGRAAEGTLTVRFIEDLIERYWLIASVTVEEARRLSARRMPDNW